MRSDSDLQVRKTFNFPNGAAISWGPGDNRRRFMPVGTVTKPLFCGVSCALVKSSQDGVVSIWEMITLEGNRTNKMPVIEFSKDALGNILISKKNLKVPVNQRSYAWEEDHVETLCRDLNGAIESGDDEYFLGTIIALPLKAQHCFEIHDGQQRLATAMIVIAAIRDYYHDHGDVERAQSIASNSLYSKDWKTLAMRPHLQLSAEDNQFFVDRILRAPKEPERIQAAANLTKVSHERIDQAAKTVEKFFFNITNALPLAKRIKLLRNWLLFLESGARVIWVEVGDQPTAYRVFETMNDRGLRLSESDLIKNYLCSLADAQRTEIVHKWQTMTATLESLGREDGDAVDFIRYLWITEHGHTRRKDLFDALKQEVNSETTALSFAGKLETRCQDYAAIISASHVAWNKYHLEVRSMIGTLRYLGVTQIRPLLMAAFRHFDKNELEKLIKAAVNWSVRCLLSGVPSGTLEGYYSKGAKDISSGKIKTLDTLATEMAAVIPADQRFKESVAITSVPTASLSRYYLRRLQMEKDGDVDQQYVPGDGQGVTLEHVLPVNPGPDWKHIKPDEAKANYNRLGNQALLSGTVNSKLGNVGFGEKKKALKESPFSLTSMIAKKSFWTTKDISDRQKALADLAVQAWPFK